MFFWLKRLKHPNRKIWECSNCGKEFHWNSKKGSIDYYYFSEFTEKYEKFVFCKAKCFDSFYVECRETPYMRLITKIREVAVIYLLNNEVLVNDLPQK